LRHEYVQNVGKIPFHSVVDEIVSGGEAPYASGDFLRGPSRLWEFAQEAKPFNNASITRSATWTLTRSAQYKKISSKSASALKETRSRITAPES
jgi:hypothetical protein